MRKDGIASANNNEEVAVDAMGYNLGYYLNDYSAVGSPSANFEANIENSYIASNMDQLYNGNIAYMTTAFSNNALSSSGPQAMIYSYDQLNRIKGAEAFTDINITSNQWGTSTPQSEPYKTSYIYDANGNITELTRKGAAGEDMDNFSYKYHQSEYESPSEITNWEGKETNRLLAVLDVVNNGTEGLDLKPGQAFDDIDVTQNNYAYDEIGNLIKDEQENIANIEWTVSGKVKAIKRGDRLNFDTSTQPDHPTPWELLR
ncbi:MAG: hypothetical protein JKY48_10360 [Flavobacteriales bacterium]|nr:hypothetical protein [Flavobacteriales bacterium]